MREAGGVRVGASLHAAERALERIDALRGLPRDRASRWLEDEALAALLDGRKSLRCPRWCIRKGTGLERRGRVSREGTNRFVWNEEETVAMVVVKINDVDGRGSMWLVKTVYSCC